MIRRTRKAGKSEPVVESPDQTEPVLVPEDDEPEAAVGSAMQRASVPPMSIFNAYISRKFTGGHSDFDLFDFAHKTGTPMLIEGPTGPGKTMATRAWAAKRKKAVARVPCNVGIEPSQLFGKYVPAEGGGFRWVDGPVTHVVRYGGVVLINEVNFMPERVATVLFGLLDANREIVLLDHEGEVIKAHKDLLIVADMNPDYEGTRPLNKAFRNRFGLQLAWDYDPIVEAKLVKSQALRAMAIQIRNEAAKGSYETPVSTNMLMEFERIAEELGLDFAAANFVNHFLTEERAPIKLVVDTHRKNIERDLTTTPGDKPESKPKDKRDDKYDPEWDIYGIEWVYADERGLVST